MKTTESEQYQKAIQILVSARNERGFSQADLALRLDKPQSFVAKYELFRRRLDAVEFIDVCRTIGVNPVTVMLRAGLINRDDLQETDSVRKERK